MGQSVTGGYVYRGQDYPTLRGTYFFADFVSGRIWSMTRNGTRWNAPVEELDTGYNIASFGEDAAGELYVVDFGGTVYRLTSNCSAPASCCHSDADTHVHTGAGTYARITYGYPNNCSRCGLCAARHPARAACRPNRRPCYLQCLPHRSHL